MDTPLCDAQLLDNIGNRNPLLVEATFELRRHGTVLRRLGKGSKSICPKVPCVVEENFFVQVFSHCHIEHALGHTLKLLL